MRALIALAICIVICFIFSDEIYQFLTEPFNRAISDRGREPYQIVTGVQETFLVYLRMSLYAGLFLAFPIIVAGVGIAGAVVTLAVIAGVSLGGLLF